MLTPSKLPEKGMGKPPSSLLKRTSQTKKSAKFNLKSPLKLLSKSAISIFVLLLTLALIVGNLQARNTRDFLEEDSSIFISLIKPKEEELETVKSTPNHTPPQQNKLFALASFAPTLGQASLDTSLSSMELDGSALIKTSIPKDSPAELLPNEIINYEVKEGETISTIAAKFGISSNTIFWANEGILEYADSLIKPGDTLKILPVTGVSHQVKDGETLEAIVQKYQADLDQTMAYNNLINASDIEEGQILIIPGGKKAEPKLKPKPRPVYLASAPTRRYSPTRTTYVRSGRRYVGGTGWCTGYARVKSGKNIRGNAGTWLSGARAKGYEIGNAPRPGAIVVTNESYWGHVAVVESVNSDGSITISEQNYKGYGIVSQRTLSANSGRIKGYVY